MRVLAAFLAFVSLALPAFAQSLQERRERYLNIDMALQVLDQPRQLSASDSRIPASPQPIASLQVRFKVVDPGSRDWTVVVESLDGSHRELIPAGDVQGAAHWTSVVPGGLAVLRLLPDGTTANIQVDAYAIPVRTALPQGLIGQDDSKFLDEMAIQPPDGAWIGAVGRLQVMTSNGRGTCTAFLVGSNLALTNQHCIADEGDVLQSWVEFGVDSKAATPANFKILTLLASDERLDYSLIQLAGDAASRFGRLYLGGGVTRSGNAQPQTIDMWVVQHPRGEPKKVAFPPNCSVQSRVLAGVNGARNDFGHTCDTRRGSSGAPLLDLKTGLVLGLHHWDVNPLVTKPEDQQNQAIHIDLIANHLRTLSKNGHLGVPKAVLDEVLKAKP